MTQSFNTAGSDVLASTNADSAISRLASNYRRLVVDEGRVDTQSELGLEAVTVFLKNLEEAATALGLAPASRSYRADFTVNYRVIFPDESRNYRVDILEGSLEQDGFMWVNSDKFEFSAETISCAATLESCWTSFLAILSCWDRSESHHVRLRSMLVELDAAWAAFENVYINELINIEANPRKLVVTAIEHEKKLQDLEIEYGREAAILQPEYMETLCNFIEIIAHLNSVANHRRKGRDDLSVDILLDAMKTLQTCKVAEENGESQDFLLAARALSRDVVSSFLGMRGYLRVVSTCLEQVDPQLCNNDGLVGKLVNWEKSWELSKKYAQDQVVLTGVCDFVAGIRQAQKIVPGLKTMCEDFDTELFMVLPRILWLQGLAQKGRCLHVFRSLLPHRFTSIQVAGDNNQEQWSYDPELGAFLKQFHRTYALLVRDRPPVGTIFDPLAWKVLVKRVVLGSEVKACEDAYSFLSPSIRGQAEEAVENFMNKMEGWSMEIQRHCAEDWNHLMSVVVHCCLSDEKMDLDESKFEI